MCNSSAMGYPPRSPGSRSTSASCSEPLSRRPDGRSVHLVGNVILIAANLSPPAYFAFNGESRTAAGHA
jgi:hypothetical protein